MSLDVENLKFTIFGSGFDDTRNDSGIGMREPDIYNLNAGFAMIDETETYVWLSDGLNWTHKYRLSDFTEVSQPYGAGSLVHPSNVANNIGVLIARDGYTYVFDLTDNSLIAKISQTYHDATRADSVLIDDVIYICNLASGAGNLVVHTIDLENETHTDATLDGNRACYGFVDENTIFSQYPPIWFYMTATIYGYAPTGGVQWSHTSSGTGSQSFPRVSLDISLCRNGKIYTPTAKGDSWVMGEYNGNSAPDMETPTPIRTYGRFSAKPLLWNNSPYVCYNQGKTKATFSSNIGTYLTDFQTIYKLADDSTYMKPLAMTDHWVISQRGTSQTSVLRI